MEISSYRVEVHESEHWAWLRKGELRIKMIEEETKIFKERTRKYKERLWEILADQGCKSRGVKEFLGKESSVAEESLVEEEFLGEEKFSSG